MLLISDFLLLPFAHLKITLFGLPLYALEIPILAAALLFLYGVLRGMPPLRIPLFSDTVLSIGIVCFIGGTLLSFITNPFSLTGLGLIKSWFLFPLIAAMLWSAISDTAADTKKIFTSWFIAASGIALGALAFLSIGHLTYDHRLEAWYTSPNFLAVILASGLIVGVFILSSLFEKHASTKKVFLIAIGVTLIAIALFFTRSYGAWGALSISLSVFSLSTTSRETRRIILFIGIAALSIYALSESGSAKWHALLSLDERSSLASRAMIWNSAITIITDHPVIGIGVGRFQETYLAYQ
jgi:O-antigen ligase